ncbi:B-cell receptor-associated protein 29 [Eumeta japonica]|uniref:Endoplasmic reticulum transmembrane protein n=1 Tax=Eumeta variegata TaxID=151549 RepID=A0A4C1X6Z6_EUMVA|nr:B-cell receptor-associated protein 29 [Eumeta japonica]
MRKYSHPAESVTPSLANDMKNSIRLFRAQRNFYITSFAIFLAFVIRRLINMIIIQAEMLEKSSQIIQEAERAKELAKTTVLAHTIHSAGDSNVSELQAQLESLQYLLNEEKNKTKLLEEQINQWKTKYEKTYDLQNDK